MRDKLQVIGLALACLSMMFGVIAMVFVTAFPKDDVEDAISEDNMKLAEVRKALYEGLN